MNRYITLALRAGALAAAAALSCAHAEPPPIPATQRHWATSWIAPAEPVWGSDFVLPVGMPQQIEDATLRQSLRISVGGERIRLVISNEYGDRPLKIGSAHVALEAEGAQAWATFQGAGEVLVAAGARALALLAFSVLAWDTVSNRTASPPAAGRRLPL